MQVKSRIFPYPVLNHDPNYSNYDGCDFELLYEETEDENNYILKNTHFNLKSDYLNKLLDDGKITIYCVIECSYTVFRKAYPLVKGKCVDIVLPKSDFSEKVDISVFACANENLVINSNEFDVDYKNIDHEIEKYDILAADDGFFVYFKHQDLEDSFAASIFSIIIDREIKDNTYNVDYESSRRITISLSEKEYQNYKTIYSVPTYKEVFFNMLLIPSLTEALTICNNYLASSDSDIESLGNKYQWFRSVADAYSKLNGKELTREEYLMLSPVKLSQQLLGQPLGKSLENLIDEMNKFQSGGYGDE